MSQELLPEYYYDIRVVPRMYPTTVKQQAVYYNFLPRIYCVIVGESQVDNIKNRWTRPWEDWQRQVVPAVLETLGLPPDIGVEWSQNAGSKAGADPGFIIDLPGAKFDVWVRLTYT